MQLLENLGGGTVDTDPIAMDVGADNPNFVVTTDLNQDGASDVVTGNGDLKTIGSVSAVLTTVPVNICPWDCAGDEDANVGITDFLALLGQWGELGSSCDFGAGAPGVDINEFLLLLANWGACPP